MESPFGQHVKTKKAIYNLNTLVWTTWIPEKLKTLIKEEKLMNGDKWNAKIYLKIQSTLIRDARSRPKSVLRQSFWVSVIEKIRLSNVVKEVQLLNIDFRTPNTNNIIFLRSTSLKLISQMIRMCQDNLNEDNEFKKKK